MLEGKNIKKGFYMMIYGEIWEGFSFLSPPEKRERIKSTGIRRWGGMEAKSGEGER